MDTVTIYSVVAGGILVTLTLIRVICSLKSRINTFSMLISKHLAYPCLLKRHRLFGPWTRANVLLYIVYGVVTIFFIAFRVPSASEAARRAGTLSLVNMGVTFIATHLSFLADCLGISLKICRRIHRAAGWMAGVLLTFHIILHTLVQRAELSFRNHSNLFGLIGAASLIFLLLFSLPFCRRLAYEIFLRTHQSLAAVSVYATWRHLPSDSIFPRIYIYVPLGILSLTTLLQFLIFLYRNRVLSSQLSPRALVTCEKDDPSDKNDQVEGRPIKIHVTLPQPLEVKAGQYVNLWVPSVGLGLASWMQTHPFMVTSWSPGKQDVLELFAQTRRGLTAKLQARAAVDGSASFTVFVSGPHGLSEPVSHYETVLAIASGFGIAGVLPYLKQLLHGYNTSTSSIRRVHLVWQVETLDIAIAAQPLLNSLLVDDVLDNGYILEMSFYMESSTKVKDERPFGKHKRAMLYHNQPNYREIILSEVSGDYIPRLPNIHEERGRLLVMVSVSDELRDRLQEIVRSYLHDKVGMCEVEFQPV
ncbi:hypothetical protein EMCG_05636 [[Emmonsia] crescens]|uniref:FAD-binding FR-type domain-containing protein n=1 Tax=[Emmonsia] crescens TaxID=73230 RepID=A0A0G2IEG6_9EURO|nr:hypothetical protein EMCG_05636 [Emmonsia crescens UAMH 3008]